MGRPPWGVVSLSRRVVGGVPGRGRRRGPRRPPSRGESSPPRAPPWSTWCPPPRGGSRFGGAASFCVAPGRLRAEAGTTARRRSTRAPPGPQRPSRGPVRPSRGSAAALPGVRGGAVCPNLLQRPPSRRSAREESLIFRASSRRRPRPGAPLQQIRTRPRPGPPRPGPVRPMRPSIPVLRRGAGPPPRRDGRTGAENDAPLTTKKTPRERDRRTQDDRRDNPDPDPGRPPRTTPE